MIVIGILNTNASHLPKGTTDNSDTKEEEEEEEQNSRQDEGT